MRDWSDTRKRRLTRCKVSLADSADAERFAGNLSLEPRCHGKVPLNLLAVCLNWGTHSRQELLELAVACA